jgi:uncharacterized protein
LFPILASFLGRKFGIVGILLAVGAVILIQNLSSSSSSHAPAERTDRPVQTTQGERTDDGSAFAGFVLDDVQATWEGVFERKGGTYERAKLVLFDDATPTACGYGQAAVGPFYCPRDAHVYLDLSFFRALDRKLGAPGDFAAAYVIAHEVGHHVQNVMGTMKQLERERGARGARTGADSMSVRVELQADCFAGIWAHSTSQRDLLEEGDLTEAIGAAKAVGDDKLQQASQGTVQPEKWTHGSSADRAAWFRRGYQTGDPAECDTMGAASASL